MARKQEIPRPWFRSDRVTRIDSGWYFKVREGVVIGPYDMPDDAYLEAAFLRELLQQEDGKQQRQAVREFVAEGEAQGLALEVRPAMLTAARLSR